MASNAMKCQDCQVLLHEVLTVSERKTPKDFDRHSRAKPPTASPAPSISLSSSSPRLTLTPDRGTGRKIGLAKPIEALRVGLEVIQADLDKEADE